MDLQKEVQAVLESAQSDPALITLAVVDIKHGGQPLAERTLLRQALLAASVPHWCDREFLAALLRITDAESDRVFDKLRALTIVEPFPARGKQAVNVKKDTRAVLRQHLKRTDPAQWRTLVQRAFEYAAALKTEYARIEAIFHRFSLDRSAASVDCVTLDRELLDNRSVDGRGALLMNLIELIDLHAREEDPPQSDAASLPHSLSPFRQTEQHSSGELKVFDVFLCHNSEDKTEVEAIGNQLKSRSLVPWLDKWELRPGKPWQPMLERQIETIKSAAVFVGRSGLGPWQDLEQQAFLREFQRRDCAVIPVILATVMDVPRLPTFLGGMVWVDFRDDASLPLARLIWGITGTRPPELC